MKLKCLIIDDEPLAHKVILEYAKDVEYLEIVAQAYLPTKALEILRNEQIDLVFLDIKMPKINGLELLRLTENPPLVIISSAYEEYALESYELSVCDYLLKPFRLERFIKATDKALSIYKKEKSDSSTLIVKSDKRIVQITKRDIYYIESYGNYIKIWLENKSILTMKTLSSVSDEVANDDFYRVHKSYLVNKHKINFIEGNTIHLKNKQLVPISKNYRSEFMSFFKS